MDNFYVEKVWLGDWRYRFVGIGGTGDVSPGFAVFSAGMPVVYRIRGQVVEEVFDLKGATQRETDYLNRHGLHKILGEPIHVAREHGRFPQISRRS